MQSRPESKVSVSSPTKRHHVKNSLLNLSTTNNLVARGPESKRGTQSSLEESHSFNGSQGSPRQHNARYSTQQVSDLLKHETREKEKLMTQNYHLQRKQVLEYYRKDA